MAYPLSSASHETRRGIAAEPARPTAWRCTRCEKMLGIDRDGKMHIRFSRGHEYFAAYPCTAICRHCGTLNRAVASGD